MNRLTRKKNENFTTISNEILRDKRISLKARGLMLTVMGLPDTWDFSLSGIKTILKEGSDAIRTALAELEEYGYCTRTEIRRDDGTFVGVDYEFCETPTEYPITNQPILENPISDNPIQLKKQRINKTQSIKETKNADATASDEKKETALSTIPDPKEKSVPPPGDHQKLMAHHHARLGRTADGAAQAKNVKAILKDYDADTAIACYQYQLTTWRESVSWKTVNQAIAEWVAKGKPTEYKQNGKSFEQQKADRIGISRSRSQQIKANIAARLPGTALPDGGSV